MTSLPRSKVHRGSLVVLYQHCPASFKVTGCSLTSHTKMSQPTEEMPLHVIEKNLQKKNKLLAICSSFKSCFQIMCYNDVDDGPRQNRQINSSFVIMEAS